MFSAQPGYALARATFKRAQRGLFGGKHIQFGNNVITMRMDNWT
jgi:large subunit ribosomal protein L28